MFRWKVWSNTAHSYMGESYLSFQRGTTATDTVSKAIKSLTNDSKMFSLDHTKQIPERTCGHIKLNV